MNRIFTIVLLIVISGSQSFAQRLKKADRNLASQLRAHVSFLADDKLEGRRAGTAGEKLAMDYISEQFKNAGLQPKGSDGWFQAFDIYDGKKINPGTHLIINSHDLKLDQEYFPFSFSANKSTEAAVAMVLPEKAVPWFRDLKDILEENSNNPHFDLYEGIRMMANTAGEKGATALIVYNSGNRADSLAFMARDRSEPASIPVMYLRADAKRKYIPDESAILDIKLKSEISNKERKGNNVIGYLDNGAATTIVLGAHYDHLGYGEDGNSMIRNGIKEIHNGADDNASGIAALIELARMQSKSKNKQSNYLFIAFSGEELGLNGSKYFTENPTIDLNSVSYMINMDMIGRLNEQKSLTVGGYGTSSTWGELLPSLKEGKYFTIKYDSSGTGPSDHTSFYRKDKPVLFFFTGLHTDYHKPTDDADKINYTGQLFIVKYIASLLDKTSGLGQLAFQKTREQQMGTTARFTVSLGIMPDYTYSGAGVRVDGVSAGRIAEKAGIKQGDIITKLGDHSINSMENYMQALAKFKKGDSTKLIYKRGDEELEAEIQF